MDGQNAEWQAAAFRQRFIEKNLGLSMFHKIQALAQTNMNQTRTGQESHVF